MYKVNLRVFELAGTNAIPMQTIIKSAQDLWRQQSEGTISLVVKSQQTGVDPCVDDPGCAISSVANLLIMPTGANSAWSKTREFLDKFDNRLGINVVHIRGIDNDARGATLKLPVPDQVGKFYMVNTNIVVLPDNTGDNLKHEIGHALGLDHVRKVRNLMCGSPPTPDSNGFLDFLNGVLGFVSDVFTICTETYSTSLTPGQLQTAKEKAAALEER